MHPKLKEAIELHKNGELIKANNILLDKLSSNEKNLKQCSGFNFIVKK